MEHINKSLYLQVKEVLEINKAERHLRGGMATKIKYKGEQAGEPQTLPPEQTAKT